MPLSQRATLTQFLIEERRRFPDARGDFNALIMDVAMACKAMARTVALGALGNPPVRLEAPAGLAVPGRLQESLDAHSSELFMRLNEQGGCLAGLASDQVAAPLQIPAPHTRGKYLLVFDALDGSGNIDVNVSVGSIFSILRAPHAVVTSAGDVSEADFLQPGSRQVAAGYALYGPTTMLVLTVGNGVNGFTLEPNLGEFMLTHPRMQIPPDTQEFAINASNSRFWAPPIKRYVDECLAGRTGPRGKDFTMRWIASMVAEAHRILIRGGVFMDPRDSRDPDEPGRLRLLFEANPIGFIMEQAGGRASTGQQPVLQVVPTALSQQVGLVFGSKHEVERIERYHAERRGNTQDTPLFAERGLFRF